MYINTTNMTEKCNMMDNNKNQAMALSFLASQLLLDFFKTDDGNVNLDFLNFNNDHYIKSSFYNCPACAKNGMLYCGSLSIQSSNHGLTPIYYCSDCGTIRTPQRFECQFVSADTNNFSSVNNSLLNHLGFEKRNRGLAQVLLKELNVILGKIESIVEIGCGPGWLLDEAQKEGIKCVGYDLGTDSITYGKEKFSLNLKNEIFSVDTKEDFFDLLICIMVFEHIQSPDDLANTMAYHCKKNNSPALLSVPITENLNSLLDSLKDMSNTRSLFRYAPGHTCHYTQEGFAKLWRRHGAVNMQRLKIPNSWPFLFLVSF